VPGCWLRAGAWLEGDQPLVAGVPTRLASLMDADFAREVVHVPADRAHTRHQRLRDPAVEADTPVPFGARVTLVSTRSETAVPGWPPAGE
jgi:hypothetical protein